MDLLDQIKRDKDQNTKKLLGSDNPLNQYASFNQLFTLSALTRESLYTLEYTNNDYKLKNVIARSGGLSGAINNVGRTSTQLTMDDGAIASQINTLEQAGEYARNILNLGQDLFFERVTIETVPAANDIRQMAQATQIRMEIHEPLGLSFITKLRGASYDAGFNNHVTAPYLLTIEYQGYDNLGQPLKLDQKYTRQIPIKMIRMDTRVNHGGSIYEVLAVPFNEYAMVDRFNKVRSEINITENMTHLKDVCKVLTQKLNEMIDTEISQNYFEQGKEDKYLITCDPSFANQDIVKDNTFIENVPLYNPNRNVGNNPVQSSSGTDRFNKQTAGDVYKKLGQIAKGTAISAWLSSMMKLIRPFSDYEYLMKQWLEKAKLGQGKSEDDYYFNFYRIVSGVRYEKVLDGITKDHRKVIHFHIEPYKLHILNLSQPGLNAEFDRAKDGLLQEDKFIARKQYQYIFTGANTEILDLDLRYNMAYFAPMYKSPNPVRLSTDNSEISNTDTGRNKTLTYDFSEAALPDHQYVTYGGKQAEAGVIRPNPAFDLFVDGFSNPEADMVNVQMTIRGDPTYLSANQFNILSTPESSQIANNDGSWTNQNRAKSVTGLTAFDDRSESFNMNLAEPFVGLTWRFPVDVDLAKGTYKLNDSQRPPFNGLYRLYGVNHEFDRGQFKQVLKMVRFKNQGNKTTAPQAGGYTSTPVGNVPEMLDLSGWSGYNSKTIGEVVSNGLNSILDWIKKKANDLVNTGKSNDQGPLGP